MHASARCVLEFCTQVVFRIPRHSPVFNEGSPSMLQPVWKKDSWYRQLDIGSPKFFRKCLAASYVWQLMQMMPLKLRKGGILESNNQISDSFAGSSFVRHPTCYPETSSTLRKLLCVPSQSAECMGEGPLFWMGLSCGETSGRQSKLWVLACLNGMTSIFTSNVAWQRYGMDMCRIFWNSSYVPVSILVPCAKTIYTQSTWMRTSFFATLRAQKTLKYPVARHSAKAAEATSNSFHQQPRVSYVSDDAVLELPFPWSLCYLVLTLPCRSLDEN